MSTYNYNNVQIKGQERTYKGARPMICPCIKTEKAKVKRRLEKDEVRMKLYERAFQN